MLKNLRLRTLSTLNYVIIWQLFEPSALLRGRKARARAGRRPPASAHTLTQNLVLNFE